jgi:hypothetical protein
MLETSNPRAVEGIDVRHAGGDVIVHDPANDKIHILNRSAGVVLDLCDGAHATEQIAAELSERTGAPPERVLEDVQAVLASFKQLRLVR